MPIINFPYGTQTIGYEIPASRLKAELVSKLHHYKPGKSQQELVNQALQNPTATPRLSVMAEGKKT